MTRDELATASQRLEAAAQSTDDGDDADRLSELAEKVDSFSTADRGPDHGQLARVGIALGELADSSEGETLEDVEQAHELVKEYRAGVEGV